MPTPGGHRTGTRQNSIHNCGRVANIRCCERGMCSGQITAVLTSRERRHPIEIGSRYDDHFSSIGCGKGLWLKRHFGPLGHTRQVSLAIASVVNAPSRTDIDNQHGKRVCVDNHTPVTNSQPDKTRSFQCSNVVCKRSRIDSELINLCSDKPSLIQWYAGQSLDRRSCEADLSYRLSHFHTILHNVLVAINICTNDPHSSY